jgi:hypothetical protein
MRKSKIFLSLALVLITCFSVQAETISYTIKETFTLSPYFGTTDPLGIGSGSAEAVINFTLNSNQIPYDQVSGPGSYSAQYTPANTTLTLKGTNDDGTYITDYSNVYIGNGKKAENFLDQFNFNGTFKLRDGKIYSFGSGFVMPSSFYKDNVNPPLPKIINQNNVINEDWAHRGGINPVSSGSGYSTSDVKISSTTTTSTSSNSKLYGLFVGIRYYNSSGEPVYIADTGATIAGKKLNNITGEGNIQYLPLDSKNSDNKNKIIEKINKIKDKMQTGDTFILYLGGHGGTFNPENKGPETTVSANNEYFALTADLKNGISDNELYSYLNNDKFNSINKWVIIDACHSGGFWGNNNSGDAGDLEKLKNIALLTASGEDTDTFHWEPGGYGIFTIGLINAFKTDSNKYMNADLNENGSLSFSELYKYMDERWPLTDAFKNYVGKILYKSEFGDEVVFTADMWDPQFFTSGDFLDNGIQVAPIPMTAVLVGPFLIGFVAYHQISSRRRT